MWLPSPGDESKEGQAMSLIKDLWQQFYEDNLRLGFTEKDAADLAYEQMRDDLLEWADVVRARRKENQE